MCASRVKNAFSELMLSLTQSRKGAKIQRFFYC
jgi:hypothetical protein